MKRIIHLLFIITPFLIYGQQENTAQNVSLEQAVQIGLQNRFDNKANQLSIKIATTRISQQKNNWLPNLHATADLKYSPQLQNSVLPGGVLPGFNETTLLPLTVKNQSVFSLQLDQPIFDASITNRKRIAQNELAIERQQVQQQEVQIKLLICQTYMNAQLKALQKKIAIDIAQRNKDYEKIAEGKYKSGGLIENNFLRARLDRENAENMAKQATQEYEISIHKLRYCLNLPERTVIQLTDSLDSELKNNKDIPTHYQRPELIQLNLLKETNELSIHSYRQMALPKVSLVVNYSQQFLSNQFDYNNANWWSPFSYGLLQVKIPLSQTIKSKSHIAEYQQRLQQTDMLIAQKKSDIDFEILIAKILLDNALINMDASRKNYELSAAIVKNQFRQYLLGSFEYSELINTEKSLSDTERNFVQSAYDLILARIELLKATNQL